MQTSYNFTHAIIRRPARSVVAGLRAGSGPDPTFDGVAAEHAAYAAALVNAGLAVTLLPPLDAFPDSVFVEDPALVFSEGAILLRPGAPSRRAEPETLAATLRDRFETVLTLGEGFVDGGDVLATPAAVFIGLSARTDKTGAAALALLLDRLARPARIVDTPAGVLHLKTDCALLDDESVLATPRLAASGVFGKFKVILTAPGEEASANALRINQKLFVGAGYPRTIELLARAGFDVAPLAVDEISRIDAGLSCMSLRWRAI